MLHIHKVKNELSWDIHKLVNMYGYQQVYSREDLIEMTFIVEKKGDSHYITYNAPDTIPLNFDDVIS